MTWNYRVLRAETGELGIHEVYYDDDQVASWSADPMPITGETVEELATELGHMAFALQQRILDETILERTARVRREHRADPADPTGPGAEQPDQPAAG